MTVNTLSDTTDANDDLISLREAIIATNSALGADTINFAPSLTSDGPAILTWRNALPTISDALTIAGPGAEMLTLKSSGGGIFNIRDVDNASLIDVSLSGLSLTGTTNSSAIMTRENLTLTDCIVSGNASSLSGGAIYSMGGSSAPSSLTIVGCTISNNSSNSEGGAIRKTYGSLMIRGSALDGNRSRSAGGAISAADGGIVVRIENSIISNNTASTYYGGGLFVKNGYTTVKASTISGNSAPDGGGIYAQLQKEFYTLDVTDTTISNNSAKWRGGGLMSGARGTTTITGSAIVGNSVPHGPNSLASGSGGGAYLNALRMVDSTVSGNAAGIGGGIMQFGNGEITNSTISGNVGVDRAGALFSNFGQLTIRSSTITANTSSAARPGAIVTGDNASTKVRVYSSIVAGNVNGDVAPFQTAILFESLGYNLIGTGPAVSAFNQPGDQTGVLDPMLGPLADNGGPTKTHALLAGSPAINGGDLSALAGVDGVPTFDQRGASFGRVFNGRIDVGAFEYQQASDLNLVVDTLVDESDGDYSHGDLSLREAIALANLYPSRDTIRFDSALTAAGPATILLTRGELLITSSLTINGPGADMLTIDASGNDPTPELNNGDGSRVFVLNNLGGSTILSGLTLTGGDVTASGGAILNYQGGLTLRSSRLTGNHVTPPGRGAGGGAIYGSRFVQTIIVEDSTLVANSSGTSGGAVSSGGTLTLRRSTVMDNVARRGSGGGIEQFSGRVMITDGSTVEGNSAGMGGGISIKSGAALTLAASTVSGNKTIGGSFMHGAGIYAQGDVTVNNSTISGNSAADAVGGGLWIGFDARAVLTNSTISGNDAVLGGAIYGGYSAAISLQSCTVTQNTTGLYASTSSTRFSLNSSIVAGNQSADILAGGNSVVFSSGYNIVGTSDVTTPLTKPGDQLGVTNPALGPLAYNGGPTLTHAPLPGSPVIDAGDPATPFSVTAYDQRGKPYFRVYGGRIDVGAYEVQPTDHLLADFNRDGVVDSGDYTIARKQAGTTVPPGTGGDANGDGVVSDADLAIWRFSFGMMYVPVAAQAQMGVVEAGGAIVETLVAPAAVAEAGLDAETSGDLAVKSTKTVSGLGEARWSEGRALPKRVGRWLEALDYAGRMDAALDGLVDARVRERGQWRDLGVVESALAGEDGEETCRAGRGAVLDEVFELL